MRSGDVVAEVSGRPVIAMVGHFPAYRDVCPGMSGPDVAQLQRSLQPLYGIRVDGHFGAATEAAISRLYRRLGYLPVIAAGRVLLPVGELAYVPSLPATVTAAGPKIGADARGVLAVLGSGPVQVVAPISEEVRRTLEAGAGVEPRFGDGPLKGALVSLVEVRELPPDQEGSRPSAEAVFEADQSSVQEVGGAQQVWLAGKQSRPDALIVPLSALWTAVDGGVTVLVVDSNTHRAVSVEVELTVRGECVVSGELAVGDQVVVGER
ncbi:hypothetical protein [Micromonospora sp. LOL_015]|uniref:hypothetical protein n=1 Tax=Micromonospora sp. LOL_015 TaxID=3345416 RepID=UPI003A857330